MKNVKKSLVNINYLLSKSRKVSQFFFTMFSKNEYVKMSVSTPIEKFANYVSIIKENGFSIVDEIRNLDNEIEISFDDGYFGIFENLDFYYQNIISGFLFVPLFLMTRII